MTTRTSMRIPRWMQTAAIALLCVSSACAPAQPDAPQDELSATEDGGASEEKALPFGSYQAESRTATKGCVEAKNYSGYTGSGFMDFGGNGTYIEWNNIAAPEAGIYELRLRYANGGATDRAAAILVNGVNDGKLRQAVIDEIVVNLANFSGKSN